MDETSVFNHVIFAVANGVSVLVCLLAAIMVFCLKLYKTLVYRLALYQVLSALLVSLVEAMQVVFINYDKSPQIYNRICTAVGFLVLYALWMKLLFTAWVTFHLFCFAVLHKNFKKLEVLYAVTSLLVPALIAAVPLITHTYGLGPNACYIYANNSIALVERLVLWDGTAMLILAAASAVMVVMVIKLASQVYRRSKYEPITDRDQFWKALKQLLPLAAFPLLFFIFEIPVLILHITATQHSTPGPGEGILISADVSFALWSMASGATVIIHISVATKCGRKRKPIQPVNVSSTNSLFRQHVAKMATANTCSATRFSLPHASV